MNILFYVLLSLTAVYVVFHIGDVFKWYWNVIQIVPKKIWELIKGIFKKEE